MTAPRPGSVGRVPRPRPKEGGRQHAGPVEERRARDDASAVAMTPSYMSPPIPHTRKMLQHFTAQTRLSFLLFPPTPEPVGCKHKSELQINKNRKAGFKCNSIWKQRPGESILTSRMSCERRRDGTSELMQSKPPWLSCCTAENLAFMGQQWSDKESSKFAEETAPTDSKNTPKACFGKQGVREEIVFSCPNPDVGGQQVPKDADWFVRFQAHPQFLERLATESHQNVRGRGRVPPPLVAQLLSKSGQPWSKLPMSG